MALVELDVDAEALVSRDTEAERDLLFLEALRWIRKEFHDRVTAASSSRDGGTLGMLRQESTYQLAEFLFAIREHRISSAEGFRRLACLHNDHLLVLLADVERLRRMGLRADRLEQALFTGENMAKLMENYRRTPPSIDQSDLARLLVTVMSPETCRKLVIACEEAGFVSREKSPYGAVLVRSNGFLEETFGTCLRQGRGRLMEVH